MTSSDSEPAVFAVIGDPVAHSLSPRIHNAALAALDFDGVYVAFRVEQAGAAVTAMRTLCNLRGLSVTIPHKVAIVDHLDHLEPAARLAGAVNTVHRDPERGLVGSNSDGPGALAALREAGIDPEGRRVAILGAGGTARAVAFALAALASPAELQIVARNDQARQQLVADLGPLAPASGCPLASARQVVESAEIIINCTAVGMSPTDDETPVPAPWLSSGQVVLDAVYAPAATRLLTDAGAAGCVTVPGTELLLAQAAIQLELWTGQAPPLAVMRRALED